MSKLAELRALTGSEFECWIFEATPSQRYSTLVFMGRVQGAHCVAWQLANGMGVPEGMVIRHSCDRRRCINPAHLLLGGVQQNVDDAFERGLWPVGTKHHAAKLDPTKVRQIRLDLQSMTKAAIARKFKVNTGTIHDVWSGRTWSHV